MDTAFIIPTKGLYISRETFNSIIPKQINKWETKEVIPKTGIDIHPRVLKHYKAVTRKAEEINIARHKRKYFNRLEVAFDDVSKFKKNTVDSTVLAPHQRCVINKLINIYNKETPSHGEVLLQMDTGMGKTRVACYMINKIGLKSVVIVPTKHIAHQWQTETQKLYKDNIVVNIYNNSQGDHPKGDIVIIIINTARNKNVTFFSQFGFAIFDEVHELTSNSNKNALWHVSGVRYILGMTATPEYSGMGLLPFIEAHLGKVIYAKDIEGFLVKIKTFDVTVEAIKYNANDSEYTTPILNKNGVINTMGTLGRVIQDPNRVDLIKEKILYLYEKGHNILIFCEHREHTDNIYKSIIETERVTGGDILDETKAKVLKGGATPDTIQEARQSRIILTTYSYSRRGIDYDHLDALVLATPRKSGLKQIIGRILRYSGDNSKPRCIVDIIDNQSVFRSQYKEREKIYNERNYKKS